MGYRADRSGQSGQRGLQPLEADAFSTRLFGDLRRPPTSLPWEAPPLGEPNVITRGSDCSLIASRSWCLGVL